MACTLEQLQKTEYDILCKFAEYCEKNQLEYILAFGTLLGAVRHNGFIPWDDDIDVLMHYKEFRKFRKLIKKNPIDGYDFSWIDSNDEFYPFHYAKLRKQGTHMTDFSVENLKLNDGVWIDIFLYYDKPKTKIGTKLQEFMLWVIREAGQIAVFRSNDNNEETSAKIKLVRALYNCPDGILKFIRSLFYRLVPITCRKSSDHIRVHAWTDSIDINKKRCAAEPVVKHIFEDREFYIPEDYNEALTSMYGPDYMTPIKTHTHANLDDIVL